MRYGRRPGPNEAPSISYERPSLYFTYAIPKEGKPETVWRRVWKFLTKPRRAK